MSTLLLASHISLGALGLALGPAVMWRETKQINSGKPPHSRIGTVYHLVVLLICISAIGLVVTVRPDLWLLIPVAGASYALVLTARVVGIHHVRGWIHLYVHGVGGSYIALVTALVVVALTVDGPIHGGPLEVVPWVAPAAVGTVLIERWRRRLPSYQAIAEQHNEVRGSRQRSGIRTSTG